MSAPQNPAAHGTHVGAAPWGGPQVLAFLQAHPNEVFTRQELLLRVWGIGADQRTRTVDQHIAALRRKCALEGRLLTVCRRGYLYR